MLSSGALRCSAWLDAAVQSVQACGEGAEVKENFLYLGDGAHNNTESRQEDLRCSGLAQTSIWRCRYLCRRTKIRIFRFLVLVPRSMAETWTLNGDLGRRTAVFGNTRQGRVRGYRWNDFVSNRLIRDWFDIFDILPTQPVNIIWLYGHVARCPDADPAHQCSVRQY